MQGRCRVIDIFVRHQYRWRNLPDAADRFAKCGSLCFQCPLLMYRKFRQVMSHYAIPLMENLQKLDFMKKSYCIGSAQYWRRPHFLQCSPRHTLSKCSIVDSTRPGSSVRIPASKLRRLVLFMPIPAPVRFAEPI